MSVVVPPYSPSVGYTGEGDPGWPRCECGLGAILRDAWTLKNAGRRFYGCQNYGKHNFCGFHECYDGPTPDYLKETILGLRYDSKYAWKKVVEVEAEVERLKKVAVDCEAEVLRSKNIANNASYEVVDLKDEAEMLRIEVKKLKQQRFWLVVISCVVVGMLYWLS